MKYKILRGAKDEISDLEQQVNEHIKKGWKPQGGVAITEETYPISGCKYLIACQAMVKED